MGFPPPPKSIEQVDVIVGALPPNQHPDLIVYASKVLATADADGKADLERKARLAFAKENPLPRYIHIPVEVLRVGDRVVLYGLAQAIGFR